MKKMSDVSLRAKRSNPNSQDCFGTSCLAMTPAVKPANRKGMSTMEYAILILAIIMALLAMQTTLRRAISGKWRAAADAFGDGRQYEEGVTVR